MHEKLLIETFNVDPMSSIRLDNVPTADQRCHFPEKYSSVKADPLYFSRDILLTSCVIFAFCVQFIFLRHDYQFIFNTLLVHT